MDEKLRKIQELLAEWCCEHLKCNIIPAVLFTADGSVVVVHYTGETEHLQPSDVEEAS